MDLQYFPMDSQLCYIEIESCKYLIFVQEYVTQEVIISLKFVLDLSKKINTVEPFIHCNSISLPLSSFEYKEYTITP